MTGYRETSNGVYESTRPAPARPINTERVREIVREKTAIRFTDNAKPKPTRVPATSK